MCKQLHNKPKYNKICFISFVNVPQGFKQRWFEISSHNENNQNVCHTLNIKSFSASI